jgi:hypothetical protein
MNGINVLPQPPNSPDLASTYYLPVLKNGSPLEVIQIPATIRDQRRYDGGT